MQCKLEKLDFKFAADLAAAIGDKRVQNNLRDLPYPYTEENAREFISYAQSSDEYVFAVTVEGKFVGCISAAPQKNIHKFTAEIGYYIAPQFWGNGLATQAVKLLTEYIFGNTEIMRLYAEPFVRNKASCRVLEKAGFTFEGTLRKNAVKNGAVEDMKMYSILKS